MVHPSSALPPSRARRAARRLLALEPFWLLILAPLLLLPGRFAPMEWHWAVVAAALLFWPLRLATEGRVSLRHPLTIAAGLLLLCLPVSIWVAVDRARAWEVAGYLVLGMAGANALLLWPPTQRAPAWIAVGVLGFAAILSLAGPLVITEAGAATRLLAPLQRAAGPLTGLLGETINPNILAHVLLMAAPLAAALALTPGWTGRPARPWLRALAALPAIWLLLVLLITQSRGAWLALVAMLPLLMVLRRPRLLWPAVVGVVAVALLAVWRGPALLDLLTSSPTAGAPTGLSERLEIWQRALWLIEDAPFTGMGLGAFDRVVPRLYPYVLIDRMVEVPHAHNLLLQIAADVGLVGLLAWLAVQVILLVLLMRLLRDRSNPLRWALAAGTLTALVGMWVAGLFDTVNWGAKPSFLPWLPAALTLLLTIQAEAESSPGGEAVLY